MAEIRKVNRVSTSVQVVNIIREAIHNGELQLGDKLPNEMELAKQIGVGRSSIREGMQILASYGIVEIRQGEGTFVTDNRAEQIFEFIGYRSNNEDIVYLSQLRHLFEIGCINLICDKGISAGQCAELEELVVKLDDAQDSETAITTDFAFHEKLFSYTGNPLLIQIYHMVAKLMNSLMSRLMCREDVLRDARRAHRRILEALRVNDREGSIAAMKEHLDTIDAYAGKYILLTTNPE